jgi:hypothetical protein
MFDFIIHGPWEDHRLELTAIFRICSAEEPFDVERGSKGILGRLCKEILFSTRGLGIRQFYAVGKQLTSQQLELLATDRLPQRHKLACAHRTLLPIAQHERACGGG